MTFSYTRDIPFSSHNPSTDQPDMLVNTNSTDDLIDVDHYSFNESNGGKHRQVQMPALVAIPAGLTNGEGTLYTKTASAVSQLFYSPDNSGNQYQLTRTISASSALFGLSTNNYNGVGAAYSGGWTFLPGGLLFQYGIYNAGGGGLGSSGTIQFPVAFTGIPFVVLPVLIAKVGGTGSIHTVSVISGTVSTTQFMWNLDASTTAQTGIYWTAIGI